MPPKKIGQSSLPSRGLYKKRLTTSQRVSPKSKQNQIKQNQQNQTVNITLGNLGTRARSPRTTKPSQTGSQLPTPPPPAYSPSIIMYSPGLSNPAPFSAPIQQQTLGTSVSTPMNPPIASRGILRTGSELLNREPSLPPGQSYRLHTRLEPSAPVASRVVLSSTGSELLNMDENIPPVQAYRLPRRLETIPQISPPDWPQERPLGSSELLNMEQNIPPFQPYRLPPMLEPLPPEPVLVKQNARPNPFRDPIEPSLPSFEGRVQETDIRNFEEIRAMNDLLKKENDPYNNIDDEQQNITDSYNANQYASLDPRISDDYQEDTIPSPEPPTEMYSPPPPRRGRPEMTPTEQEIETLRQFIRVKNIPAKQRNAIDAELFVKGRKLLAAKRKNEMIQEIFQQLNEAYENSGK
jgi:hypothetical protein